MPGLPTRRATRTLLSIFLSLLYLSLCCPSRKGRVYRWVLASVALPAAVAGITRESSGRAAARAPSRSALRCAATQRCVKCSPFACAPPWLLIGFCTRRMAHHLTAAVVSTDQQFLHRIL